MSTMVAEVYDALKEAGASEDKARAAAVAVTRHEQQITELRGDMTELRGDMTELRGDMMEFRHATERRFDAVENRFDAVESKIESIAKELRGEMAQNNAKLRGEIKELEVRMTWRLVALAGLIVIANGGLLALFRFAGGP